ncbi:MAG TPA: hypothetical protein VKR21_17505 [Solirubrobacteraceae bacterium]|nr:hypothetical protein [Solirubrobacteraceae bacterium]
MLDPAHTARLQRRAAARGAIRRRRAIAVVAVVVAVIVVLLASAGGGRSPHHPAASTVAAKDDLAARAVTRAEPPGGPIAPASVGGLRALWAPQNVVGDQPGTALAYTIASRQPGLPGYLLIADRGNNRILVVDPSGRVAFTYPSAADVAAGRKLFFNDDTFVEPGGRYLIANEEDNHAIVQIGIASHQLQILFGHPGQPGSDPTHLNTPDDAYMLPNGSWTVADAYNCRILFVRNHQILRQIGHSAVCRHDPPNYLGAVNGDTPLPDGGVLVSEINGSWIDNIGPDGQLRYAFQAPVGYPSDPQPLPGGRVLLADYGRPGHVLITSTAGKVLWRYGPAAGPGMLDHPSLAMALPNGDIAVNDDFRDRVVVIDPRTKRIVWQYGHTDVGGTRPGYLHIPDGMDFIPATPGAFSFVNAPPYGTPDWGAVVHP